jgi:phosphoribosyl-AMP cyclohydrolase
VTDNSDNMTERWLDEIAWDAQREVRLDCDGDVVTLQLEQTGGIACHTGHERCFFRKLENGRWVETEAVVKHPGQIYK